MAKSSRKSRLKKSNQVSKRLPDPLNRRKQILLMLTAELMPYTIAEKLGVSQQVIWKDLQWLKKKKLIIDIYPKQNKYKFYILSELGKQMLDGYEKAEQKKSYKIENARHKVYIRNPEFIRSFIKKYELKRNKKFKNSKAWFGKVDGWSVSLFIGKQASLVITPPPLYAENMLKAHVKSNQNMLDFCNKINNKWNFDLTIPEPSTHRQYTISDDFAKKMLRETDGSQIKIERKEGTVSIDKSKGLEERIEFPTPESAQDYIEVPHILKKLVDEVHHSTKVAHQMQILLSNTIENNSKVMENFSNVMKQAFNLDNSDKPGKDSTRPINDDSSRMFS